jgi:large subunit ribosomal protein L4
MKVPVYNQLAEKVDEIELNSKIFEVKPQHHLLAESVRIQAANARSGSSNTKTRGEVRGGGKKPWKQKGTGRARAGSIRSPLWKGGGITFGPRANRNWELKMNKKAKTKALFMSLSDKVSSGKFIVVDKITLDAAKTKEFVKILASFKDKVKTDGKRSMLVLPKTDTSLSRASRNIPNMNSILASSLNVTDILKADNILVLKDSLAVIEKVYLKTQVKAK